MSKLKTYKFSDLYEMSSGISSKPEQAGHGFPFLSFSTVFNNYFLPDVLPDLMDTSVKEKEVYSIKEGDVFLTRTSETLDELGMSSVAVKEYANASYSGFLKRLRPTQSNITYPKYMAFYLRSNLFRKVMTNNAIMTLRASLNEQIFSYLELILPEFNEQKKIGDLLYHINQKIELNNKINAELEAMAKLIYDYWFVQFDFPNAKGKPYKTSGGKMVWSEELKREIPYGWEVKELNSCIERIIDHRGKTPAKLGSDWTLDENGIIALSAKIVKDGKLINLEKANRVDYNLYNKWMPVKLKDGDILMTSEAPAGEFYFIHGKTEYCLSQRLFAIRSNQEIIIPSYLYFELSKGHGYSQIMGSLSGSTVFGIRQDVLRTIKVLMPNFDLQKKFDKIILPQLKQIKELDQQNQQLSKLRDWLLPMLMNGQVKIRDAEKELAMASEPEEVYQKRNRKKKREQTVLSVHPKVYEMNN